MKIAIDARWIFEHKSGIGVHTEQLIRGLGALNNEHEWVLLFDDAERADAVRASCAVDWQAEILNYGVFSPRGQLALPGKLKQLGVDLVHSTNYMMPLLAPMKKVVTIHDLIPMRFRDHAPRSKKSRIYPVYRQLMIQIGRRADGIIAVSDASKRDIIELLQVPVPGNVHVVYNGIDARYCPDDSIAKAEPAEILYVGRLDPYKHVVPLVEAVHQCGDSVRLRIVGPPDDRYPEARQRANALGLDVDWTGSVNDAELVEAYRRATVLVLASEYEGFGLPVAEAMACGTPVICSNTSSLPEVGGDAAIQVTPGDVDALAEAIQSVVNDDALRLQLAGKGPGQAARFTTQQMAADTLAVYETLA